MHSITRLGVLCLVYKFAVQDVLCGQHLVFTFLYENTMRVYIREQAQRIMMCVRSPPDNINTFVMPLCTM